MPNQKNNVPFVYFGTPRFSALVLDELERAGLIPVAIVTTPDKPQGRGLKVLPSPVKTWALERTIPVLQPEKLGDFVPQLKTFNPQLFVVAAYGKIIPNDILALPVMGTLNVHPSLLPKYRGPSPIETQILKNEKETGVSIIRMDEELDHGPIVAQKKLSFPEWVPISKMEDVFWSEGGRVLAETIPKWLAGEITAHEQGHTDATTTKKMEKEDGRITLSDDPHTNYLKYCAYYEWPGTFFFAQRGGKEVRVKIAHAEFADGEFRVLRVIPEGKKEMDYQDFLRG